MEPICEQQVNPAFWKVIQPALKGKKCWKDLVGTKLHLYVRRVFISRDTRDFLATQGVHVNHIQWQLEFVRADKGVPFLRRYKEHPLLDMNKRSVCVVEAALKQVQKEFPEAHIAWLPEVGLVII